MIRDRKAILIRAYAVGCVFLMLGIAIVIKMLNVQFDEPDKYRDLVQRQNFRVQKISGERGNLYASDGILLATTITQHHIYIDLVTINDTLFQQEVGNLSDSLSRMFNKPSSYFLQKLNNERSKNNRYMLLVKNLNYEEYQRIKKFPIFKEGQNKGGIIHETDTKRVQTAEDVGMRTIGYHDGRGKAGLEGAYSHLLEGKEGERLERFMGNGNWRPVDEWKSLPLNGSDVYTTIDIDLQNTLYSSLYNQLTEFEAVHGCALLMEVETGKIRAMINLKRMEEGEYRDVLNHAIEEAVEPGSTVKSMVLLAGLNDEKFDTATYVDTGKGYYRINGRTIRDSHRNGNINVKQVLEQSSNVGMVKLTHQHYSKNPEELVEHFLKWKLDQPIGIDLPNEATPEIPNPKNRDKWSKQSLASFSFGYETKMTPIQILTFYNGIANGGKMLKPLFIDRIEKKGQLIQEFKPSVMVSQMASPESIGKIQEMLKGVVKNGTAENINTPNYTIAGKTGTTKVEYWFKDKPTQYMASFAGYFPAEKPKYSCYVMIYKPNREKGFYGSNVAAPVFKTIADKIYSSSPKKIRTAKAANTKKIHNRILNQKEFKLNQNQNKIPNLIGKNGHEVIPQLENYGLIVKYSGVGKVKEQSLPAGTKVKKGNTIYLKLES